MTWSRSPLARTLLRTGSAGLLVATAATFAAMGRADDAGAQGDDAGACPAWDVTYAVRGKVTLTETPQGQGDGIYAVGPGTLVVRYRSQDGKPGGAAQIRSYGMKENFTIKSKVLFWGTTVTTDTKTTTKPDACGVVAPATLEGGDGLEGAALRFDGPLRGYELHGTTTCEGSLCGKFGAPPPGTGGLDMVPPPVTFKPLKFSADGKTFTMVPTFISRTETPKQASWLSIAGREIARTCVQPKPCP